MEPGRGAGIEDVASWGLQTRHRNDLQGLRAVAVLLVALGHAGVTTLRGGFVGVDVFFVLSGFLITGLLLAEAEGGSVSISEFYVRRARRILPAAALTLVAIAVAAYYLMNFVRARQATWDALWASAFAANIHFARQGADYFARAQPPSPVQHFWTLAVEEQFYVVWPALLALVLFGVSLTRRSRQRRRWRKQPPSTWARRRLLIAASLVLAGSLAWSIQSAGATASYFSTLTRAWELALGAVLAIVLARFTIPVFASVFLGWLGLAAIAGAAVKFTSATPFPGYAALLPTVGAALVIAAGARAVPKLGVGRLLAVAPLRFVGDRSYTFYLWHWPVLIIAAAYEGRNLSLKTNLALLAGAFLLSIITYDLYENPIRHLDWSRPAALFALTATVGAVVFVAAFNLNAIATKQTRLEDASLSSESGSPLQSVTRGHKARSKVARQRVRPQQLAAVVASGKAALRGAPIPKSLTPPLGSLLQDNHYGPSGCEPGSSETSGPICRLGSPSGTRTVVLMGDSHAAMWMPALEMIADREKWVLVPLIHSGCGANTWVTLSGGKAQCRTWFKWASDQAVAFHPQIMLIASAYNGYGVIPAALDGIESLITRVKPYSERLGIIGDAPRQDRQPVDCLLSSHTTMAGCSSSPDWSMYGAVADQANAQGVGFVDTNEWFCYQDITNDQEICPMVIGRTIVYFDQNHLTATYSRQLADPLQQALLRLPSSRKSETG